MPDHYSSPDDEPRDPYGTAAPEDPELEDDTQYIGGFGDYGGQEPDIDITDGLEGKPPEHVRSRGPPGHPPRSAGSTAPDSQDVDRSTAKDQEDWKLEKVVLVALPEATDFLAAAKAASQLTLRKRGDKSERLPRQSQPYRFVYDLPEEPAKTLTDEWGDLPDVAVADGEIGGNLLETAIEKTWGNDTQVDPDESHLYDSNGNQITDLATIEELQETAAETGDDLFLVPALELSPDNSKSIAEKEAERKRKRINKASTLEQMSCWNCGGLRKFSFNGYDGVPRPGTDNHDKDGEDEDDEQKGQPMWSCTNCGAGKYGPDPNAD
jgi:hypothetical protein